MANETSRPPRTDDPLRARDELLGYLLEREGIQRPNRQQIPARKSAEAPELSFAQERFWFLDQLEPNRSAYNSCKAERLIGSLNPAALEQSINAIVRRHESLRTTFPSVEGKPFQRVLPIMTISLPVVDLQEVPEADRGSHLFRLTLEEVSTAFDLAQGPLMRAKLLRLQADEHVLLVSMHQIVFDSWSVGIFFRELWTLYETYTSNKLPSLPGLPIQYPDFAVWQRRHMQGEMLESQLTYWKRQLSDGLPTLHLPTDRPRPVLPSPYGVRRYIAIPTAATDAIRQLSRRSGATLFMTLLAAFKTLLYRYTGQEDILVGCPVVNRNLPEIENLIGSFVNTLVLRSDLKGNPTFLELLSRVRDVCLGAFAHQDLAFEQLVQELQPERDLSRNPLFQVMFAFHHSAAPRLALQHLSSEPIEVSGGASKLDLTLSLAEEDHAITGFIEYSVDLFDESTIERIIEHFQTLLKGIVADPGRQLSELPIMSETERDTVLVEWNDTKREYPKETSIHQLFEAQVKRTPHAPAVVFEGQRLSYEQLNTRANQLASYLRERGVGPEVLVGILAERSLEMVIGLLGILKTGAAYVPLDPDYPRERLTYMVEDAQVSVLLTQQHLKIALPTFEREVLCLDSDWKIVQESEQRDPIKSVTAENVTYVIFTSGTTGNPKGVIITNKGVCNRLLWMQEVYQLTTSDRVLHKTPLSFDVSVWEIFWPLLNGACLVVARPGGHQDGAYLANVIVEQEITIIHFVPSMLSAFLKEPGVKRCRSLRLVFCSGEVLPSNLQERFFARSDAALLNLYGPTEAAIDVTFWACKKGSSLLTVPIGRPIANTQIYLLDSKRQPVPIGVSGEIYISGDGLARGYLNRTELTAESFVANPFSDNPRSRLYRTGDRARYLPDGNIEFLGRIDNQIKIRGYRIELGEIEAVLGRYPSVKEGLVIAREDLEGEAENRKSLVAYFVPAKEAPSISDLRNFLKQKLPDYMIPSLFVSLEALPLTPNGKIDRNALPLPNGERPQLDQGFIEPRTEIEKLVAQVWREVLKLDKIGVYDNFFELGGHSLLAIRVVAKLRNNFSTDLLLRKLFELPTVAGLAEHIQHLRHSQFGTIIAPIVPVDRTQALPLSFSQRRLWYLQKVDANVSAYNIPAAFRVKGELNSAALERALNEVVERHEVLRCYVREVDGQPRQEILPSLRIELPVIDLTPLHDAQAETEAKGLFSTDARRLYDLANAPLMRATLLKLAVDDHVFILNFHHIIADGSSLAILYKELATLYEAIRDNKPVSFPRLPVQYADYAAWQHEWLKSSSFDAQVGYWKRQLEDLPDPCPLPTDFDRPTAQTYRGARLAVELSKELTGSLKTLSRQQNVTMFMTLFATFYILLSRISGQEDIVIGSTIAGRNHPEADGLIGFFINALPLRCHLASDPSFVTLLQHVRELCLDAYANQDVPFEKIVEEIKPRRDPGRNPIFDILFNMADTSERTLTLVGCEVIKLAQVDPGAKFDIVLHAPEAGGKIELAIVYNIALFREGRITMLLEQWAALLDQVASHPELPISQLSLVTDASRPLLPDPREALDDSWEGAIHELLAEQARRSPESLAVVDENQNWTYEEMNQYANRLAHLLIDSGIRPKDLIAIYAHRSSSLIVALFGILKANASFLILDPAYPAARAIDYLRIALPKGWLQLEGSGEPPDELLSCLDSLNLRCRMNVPQSKAEIFDNLSAYADTEPATIVTADDPAYVAFTSGSTGEPKGVLCRHGPITHFLPWQTDAFQLSERDRFALLSGLAYSHLHRDVFTASSLGATLYIPNPSEARSPDRLACWLEQNAITILHLTPALGQLLLTSDAKSLSSVRRVFFGGDVLTPEMVAGIRRRAPNATVGSFYGATETQRAVGYFEITNDRAAAPVEALKAVPLGRGIKAVQLLVLNRGRQLTGVGEIGEVYVRSPHLAEGYIGDEARTSEVFITNPFTKDPKDRLYRTGELGRYLPDGNVEWAGRNDRRVNIRGFRVELEEIEAVLKQHSTVGDAAVVLQPYEISYREASKPATQDPKLSIRLVAYVAAEEEGQSFVDLLRSFLGERLPDYMVPSHFVILDRLPLSPNGKVDYQALPSVQFTERKGEPPDAPQSEIEQKLSTIFAQVLGRENVGINEDFFRLGGHSLLAAQVAARVREAFGVALELRAFLASPTVASLARQVESSGGGQTPPTESAQDEREEFEI